MFMISNALKMTLLFVIGTIASIYGQEINTTDGQASNFTELNGTIGSSAPDNASSFEEIVSVTATPSTIESTTMPSINSESVKHAELFDAENIPPFEEVVPSLPSNDRLLGPDPIIVQASLVAETVSLGVMWLNDQARLVVLYNTYKNFG